jgi:hypothetical protein
MALNRKQMGIFWIILVLQLLLLLAFVFFRLIDYDEASYLSAAYMVANGKLPYIDFFYAQMPYVPYVYAPISSFGLASLFWGRLISALAGLILGIALFRFAYKFTQDAKLSLFLFFLYSFNGLLLPWHSVVKTLVISDLFGFLSFIFFASYLISQDVRRNVKILLSGFFVGLALNLRLTFSSIWLAEIVLIFLLSSGKNIKQKITASVFFCLGTVLSSLLGIYLFLKDPSPFIFDNLTYHQILGLAFIKLGFMKRIFTVFKFVFYPQNLFILLAAIVGIVSAKKSIYMREFVATHKVVLSAFLFGVLLTVTSFSISPTTFQHYEQTLPYFLICSIPGLAIMESKWGKRKIIIGITSALYALFVIPFVVIFILAIRERDKPYPISEVRKVVKVVEENSQPNEIIFATWPAYAIFSKREPVPGLETWGWEVAHLLSPQELKKSKLIDRQEMKEIILEKKVGLIVEWDWFFSEFGDIVEVNYRHVKTVGVAKIYKAK